MNKIISYVCYQKSTEKVMGYHLSRENVAGPEG